MSRLLFLAPFALVGLGGCTKLEDFSTTQGEAYCGSILRGRSFRAGLSPRIQMRVQLDIGRNTGKFSTYEAPSHDGGEPFRMFQDSKLEAIAPLENDALSTMDLGETYVRSLWFRARMATESSAAFVIVSLREDGDTDVRLLAPDRLQSPDLLFGFFPLKRQSGQCGF